MFSCDDPTAFEAFVVDATAADVDDGVAALVVDATAGEVDDAADPPNAVDALDALDAAEVVCGACETLDVDAGMADDVEELPGVVDPADDPAAVAPGAGRLSVRVTAFTYREKYTLLVARYVDAQRALS